MIAEIFKNVVDEPSKKITEKKFYKSTFWGKWEIDNLILILSDISRIKITQKISSMFRLSKNILCI